jgi:hypothetical protein
MPNVARSIEVGGGADFTVVINRADAVASDSFPALSRHACGAPRGQLTALLEVGLTSPNRIGAPPPSRDLGADASGSNPGSKLRQASATQDNSNPLKTAETPLHNHVLPAGGRALAGSNPVSPTQSAC